MIQIAELGQDAIKHGDSYIPLVDEKILTMPQGGAIKYRSQTEAEVHARHYRRGYTGGAIPRNPEDVLESLEMNDNTKCLS